MCGIIGIVGREEVSARLMDGLRRLEYRGYDSAGICTIRDGVLERRRAEGKLDNLARVLEAEPLAGTVGIAHTRWATHGAPTVGNALPHIVDGVAVVHNGIIENFKALREEMQAKGRTFASETDSEVVAHLVADQLAQGKGPQDAVAAVLPRLHGAFALAILFRDHPGLIIGARLGAPLTVGVGEGNPTGSDALARRASKRSPIWMRVTGRSSPMTAQIYDRHNRPVERGGQSGASAALSDKGNHAHYMQKEIYEQPVVVAQTRNLSASARAEGGSAPDGFRSRLD
jgi:glucosamine--fructose-6-phosphate aminotransferase (isomerizing)